MARLNVDAITAQDITSTGVISSANGFRIGVFTNANRPASTDNGVLIYNSTESALQLYSTSAGWISIGGFDTLPTWADANGRPTGVGTGYFGLNSTDGLELYNGSEWVSLGGGPDGSTAARAAESALAILTLNPSAPSGLYWILPAGYSGSAFQVYCDMTTNGGGWMHCGTISDQNEAVNNAAHIWGLPLNPAQDTGIWEDSTVVGSQSFTNDFKSQAWNSCPFTQFLVKDNGNSLRNLFYTNSGQISSNNSSFATFWGSLSWDASGSENSNTCYNAGRVTAPTITNFGVVDPALESGNKSRILLKFGERDGAQDGNKDRSMIAWHRHDQSDNVDLPAGLGCFTNRSGSLDRRDIVPKSNWADYPPNSISGAPLNYTLWVR